MLTRTQKRSLLFYILYTEYGKKQTEIAAFLNTQQSIVSSGLKEAKYLITINEAQLEIQNLREQLANQLGAPVPQFQIVEANH